MDWPNLFDLNLKCVPPPEHAMLDVPRGDRGNRRTTPAQSAVPAKGLCFACFLHQQGHPQYD